MALAGALAPLVREVRLGRSHSLEPSLGLLAAVTTAGGGEPQEGTVHEAVAGSGVLSLCAQLLLAVSGWVPAGTQWPHPPLPYRVVRAVILRYCCCTTVLLVGPGWARTLFTMLCQPLLQKPTALGPAYTWMPDCPSATLTGAGTGVVRQSGTAAEVKTALWRGASAQCQAMRQGGLFQRASARGASGASRLATSYSSVSCQHHQVRAWRVKPPPRLAC